MRTLGGQKIGLKSLNFERWLTRCASISDGNNWHISCFFFSLYWHSVIHFPTIRRRVDCVIQFSLVCRFSVFFFHSPFQLIYFRHISYLLNLISRNSWACRFWSIFSFVFTCVFVLFHRWKIFGINAALGNGFLWFSMYYWPHIGDFATVDVISRVFSRVLDWGSIPSSVYANIMARILFVEPFFDGSHKQLLDTLIKG